LKRLELLPLRPEGLLLVEGGGWGRGGLGIGRCRQSAQDAESKQHDLDPDLTLRHDANLRMDPPNPFASVA
jgi:hypothetical protein